MHQSGDDDDTEVLGSVATTTTAPAQSNNGGSLALTGANIKLLLLIGLALLVLGALVLRARRQG